MNNKTLASQTSTDSQKLPQTLEEQRDYYLNLFKKWEKWKDSEELKVKNEKLWNLLQEVEFEKVFEFLDKLSEKDPEVTAVFSLRNTPHLGSYFDSSYFVLAQNDPEVANIWILNKCFESPTFIEDIEIRN